jgi:hypothetical protein
VAAGTLTLRQRPGPKNSLGLAKFIFPNDENVYMHGTPASQLFSRARRDFSHGCIRLEDPARFAEWVLRDQPEWDRAHIDKAMQGDRPTHVTLKNKLTVVLFYNTAHVNSEGSRTSWTTSTATTRRWMPRCGAGIRIRRSSRVGGQPLRGGRRRVGVAASDRTACRRAWSSARDLRMANRRGRLARRPAIGVCTGRCREQSV